MDENLGATGGEQPGVTPATPAATGEGMSEHDARQWAMFCHLSALAGYVIPFGNLLGPLIVWQMKKDLSPFVDDQGKEALNFQISVTIYVIVALLTICVGVGVVLVPLVGLFGLVMAIIAGIKANGGETYRYPLTIRFLK